MEPLTSRTTGRENPIDLQKDLRKVKDTLSETALHARNKAGELIDEARGKTSEFGDNIATYVKENPLAAVGISLLAGFFVALILKK